MFSLDFTFILEDLQEVDRCLANGTVPHCWVLAQEVPHLPVPNRDPCHDGSKDPHTHKVHPCQRLDHLSVLEHRITVCLSCPMLVLEGQNVGVSP